MIKTDDLYADYGGAMPFYNHIDTCPCIECAPQDDEEPVRTLTLSFTEEGDQEANHTTIVLEDDKTTYLPTVMAAVEKMLHAMGFDYVSLVKLGDDHSHYAYSTTN